MVQWLRLDSKGTLAKRPLSDIIDYHAIFQEPFLVPYICFVIDQRLIRPLLLRTFVVSENELRMNISRSLVFLVLLQLLLLSELSDGWRRRRRRRRCYPRNCVMSSWSSWSSCSAPCGSIGIKTRRRRVLSYAYCGGYCYSTSQSASCPHTCCPVSCSYSWTAWSSCSASCMYGTRTRRTWIWRRPSCGGSSCPSSPQSQRCGNGRYGAHDNFIEVLLVLHVLSHTIWYFLTMDEDSYWCRLNLVSFAVSANLTVSNVPKASSMGSILPNIAIIYMRYRVSFLCNSVFTAIQCI